jgi:hypothetical protein
MPDPKSENANLADQKNVFARAFNCGGGVPSACPDQHIYVPQPGS